jgi:hypothetical protein
MAHGVAQMAGSLWWPNPRKDFTVSFTELRCTSPATRGRPSRTELRQRRKGATHRQKGGGPVSLGDSVVGRWLRLHLRGWGDVRSMS